MPNNSIKYSEASIERAAKLILKNRKSATSIAKEMGIDMNTVCCWIRDYHMKQNLPTFVESKDSKFCLKNSFPLRIFMTLLGVNFFTEFTVSRHRKTSQVDY